MLKNPIFRFFGAPQAQRNARERLNPPTRREKGVLDSSPDFSRFCRILHKIDIRTFRRALPSPTIANRIPPLYEASKSHQTS